ncbi:MAG: adenylate/guanylate cyclase domain-containing protein, partial [Bacteroidales bacterium]
MKKAILLKIVFFAVFCVVSTSNIFSQESGHLFVSNYTAEEYAGHVQNWSIVQDNRGLIYVGNKAQVLEYDGVSWNRISTLNDASAIRSLAIDTLNNRIYAGGVGDVGYLEADRQGLMQYVSLLPQLDSIHHKFADVWKTHYIDKSIYFTSYDNIIKYCTQKDEIDTVYVHPAGRFHIAYEINNKLYVRIQNIGLCVLEGDSFNLIPGGEHFLNDGVYSVLPGEDNHSFYAISRLSGMHFYDGNSFIKKEKFEKVDEFLLKNTVYHAIKLSDGNFAFATVSDGLIIASPEGNIIQHINKDKGLQDNTVLYLFEDRQNNIWTALYRGISMIEYSLPWEYWNEDNGLDGVAEDVTRYNDTIYVAASLGVFYLENNKFHKIPGIDSQSWKLLNVKNPDKPGDEILIVSNISGLYKISNKKVERIKRLVHAYCILQSDLHPELLIVGVQNGLEVFQIINSEIVYKGPVNNYNNTGRSIWEDKDGNIWAGTINNGLFKIELENDSNDISDVINDLMKNPNVSHYTTENGLPGIEEIRAFTLQNSLIATTQEGLFLYDKKNDVFIKDTILRLYYDDADEPTGRLIEDFEGNCWVSTESAKYFKKQDEGYKVVSKPFQRLPVMSMFSFLPEKTGHTWIGGTIGLYRFNTNYAKNFNVAYNAMIRSITLNNDSVIYYGAKNDLSNKCENEQSNTETLIHIDYQYNSLLFTYSASFFEKEDALLYSYKLDGFDEDWSSWSKETRKEYTNIGPGKYTFKVRAKNIYNNISEEDCFSFVVKPPWYLSSWAILLYVILGLLFVFVIVRLNNRRLHRKNRVLLKLVNERTAEIKEAYKELEKLSIVAKETENAITIFNKEGQIEWANDGFTKLYGFSIDEYKKVNGDNIYAASHNKDIRSLIKLGITNKKSVVYDYPAKNKKGKVIWIQTTLTPIFKADELDKLVAIDTDITKLKEVEKDLQDRTSEFTEINDLLLQQKEDLQATQEMMTNVNNMLETEKKKSDLLLLNVLPEEIAEELKKYGKAKPRYYKTATILFTDFVNFSKTAELKTPEALIEDLDLSFAYFDDILEKYNLEKIKTIGDSYMCAGGIPKPNKSNPIEMVLAGLEMNSFIKEQKAIKEKQGESFFDMRIGLHTGDLIAGVVGKKKFAYDVWGKTVNLASRMESSGKEGSVNISQDTFELIKDYFECTSRGKVGIKHSGLVEMYIVERIKAEYSEDESGVLPNIRL